MELTQTQHDFREGMSRMGAAVNLVTTDGAMGRHGLVASAACSVTDTPPSLLLCVNRSAFVHDKLLQNGVLCLNVLTAEHEDLSDRFARYVEGVDRFSDGDWTTLETGAPALLGANASFDCRISAVVERGSHSVLFCDVEAVRLAETLDRGLVYFSRDYHALEVS